MTSVIGIWLVISGYEKDGARIIKLLSCYGRNAFVKERNPTDKLLLIFQRFRLG